MNLARNYKRSGDCRFVNELIREKVKEESGEVATIFHRAGIRGAYNTRNRAFYMLLRRFNVIINHSAG